MLVMTMELMLQMKSNGGELFKICPRSHSIEARAFSLKYLLSRAFNNIRCTVHCTVLPNRAHGFAPLVHENKALQIDIFPKFCAFIIYHDKSLDTTTADEHQPKMQKS